MTRFEDGPEIEVSVRIDAPIDAVWDHVSDINLPARFQKEFVGAEWIDDGPALDARFLGRNELGEWKWQTTSWIVRYEPNAVFSWAVSDRDNPGATWTYFVDDDDGATVLRFHRRLGPGPSGITASIERNPENEERIIADRDASQRKNMLAVVEGIKELAEASS